jgi:hypothetical protein
LSFSTVIVLSANTTGEEKLKHSFVLSLWEEEEEDQWRYQAGYICSCDNSPQQLGTVCMDDRQKGSLDTSYIIE